MFGIGKKKEQKEHTFSRIEVEDLLDQEMTCKEVAQELLGRDNVTETDISPIYRIKQARERRRVRMSPKSERTPEADKLKELEVKLKEAELADKLAQMEHNNFIRAMERKDELIDLQGNDDNDYAQESSSDKLLLTLLAPLIAKMGAQNAGNSVALQTPPSVLPSKDVISAIEKPAIKPNTLEEAKSMIKAGSITKADVLLFADENGLSKKKALQFYEDALK